MNGAELREKRKELNMTQTELAEALGVSMNSVARWERDEVPIAPYLHLALEQIKPKRAAKKAK